MEDLQKEILSSYNIEIRSYRAVKIDDIPGFLKKIDEITARNDDSIIQLLDSDYLCGKQHLNQALVQAIKSFDEKQNFAKDKGLEICVRASAQKQISQAIKVLGIKTESDITVVYVNVLPEQIVSVEDLLGDRDDSLLDVYDEKLIVKTYNLFTDENIINQLNEKIALLALK